jgi:hypothetical protein
MLKYLRDVLTKPRPTPVGEAKFVYLHIPKTAGSAIKAAIKRSPDAGRFICKPHRVSFAQLSKEERALETFVSIRDPLAWYLSLYNFKMHSESDKGYGEMERNSLADFLDDMVYVRNGVDGIMRWNRPAEFKQHVAAMAQAYVKAGAQDRIGFFTVNFLYYAAPRWEQILNLPDPNAALAADPTLVGLSHVLRQEHLADDFAKMTAGEPVDVELKTRVNAMDSNPYLDSVDAATVAHVHRVDGYLTSLYRRQVP